MYKYASLSSWLAECGKETVSLSFSEIESIIGFKLPESAYKYPPWWSNDTEHNHSHAKAWMDVGYMASSGSEIVASHIATFRKK